MIQSLFIMSKTGEVMIEKHWRGITPRNVCDFFWDEVNRHDVPEAVPPILQVCMYVCQQAAPSLEVTIWRECTQHTRTCWKVVVWTLLFFLVSQQQHLRDRARTRLQYARFVGSSQPTLACCKQPVKWTEINLLHCQSSSSLVMPAAPDAYNGSTAGARCSLRVCK